MLKRFYTFAYNEHDARGGWQDFIGSFDTEKEALDYLLGLSFNDRHIFDSEEGKIKFVWWNTRVEDFVWQEM